jgi:hypothetical protein
LGKTAIRIVKIDKAEVMTGVEKIQSEIESLSPEEYAHLRLWFFERDWEQWDRQIERDAEAGKLDFLIEGVGC